MNIGVVGTDSDARLRVGCYTRLPDVEVGGLVATADQDPDWTAAPTYDSVDALLSIDGLDAVDVRALTAATSRIVDRCLAADVGVVCPAPPADDADDVVAIRDVAEQGERPVLVDGVHRFARENRAARDRIGDGAGVDDGDIGTPTTVRTTRRLPGARHSGESGSAERDALVRRALYPDVARTRMLFGDIQRVFARVRSGSSSRTEHVRALVVARFASGAVGHLDVSYGDRHDRVSVEFEYSGTEGRLSYDSEEFAPLGTRASAPLETGVRGRFERPRPSSDCHDRHAEHLVNCLRGETDPAEPLSEAVGTFRTALAATESARRGEPVAVAAVME